MDILLQPESWIALLTLTFLEIVLGVDNIIFISLVTQRLPKTEQRKARNLGLLLALLFRIGMLLSITTIIKFDKPLFTIVSMAFSGRDLILFAGGVFLIAKSTSEIHHKVKTIEEGEESGGGKKTSLFGTIIQIILLDIIFSIDSILTAIGLSDQLVLMIIAVVVAMIVMMFFAGKISDLINRHPTLQILALSFLILIGFTLILEVKALPFHVHIEKGFIYFAVFFSLMVEMLNIAMRKPKKEKVK